MTKENNDKAARARNKTVMLTPDIANQMRSRLMTGAHRSGSTEKLDTGLINQVRENFGAPASRERDTIDKQTQIIDTSKFMNQLPAIEEEPELEINFLDALKSRETQKPAESNSLSHLEKLDFEAEEEDEIILAPVTSHSDVEEEFVTLENLDEELAEDLMSAQQQVTRPVQESYRIEIPENNFEEEIKMNQPNGSLSGDLKRGIPSAPVKQAVPMSSTQCQNGDLIKWEKETPLVGFLVTFDGNPKGDFIILRSGRLIVSSDQADKGSVLVINDESVSPMHAIIRISEASIVVLDQLSENGTKIQKADGALIELSGDKATLEHGDILTFGERSYKVCVLF